MSYIYTQILLTIYETSLVILFTGTFIYWNLSYICCGNFTCKFTMSLFLFSKTAINIERYENARLTYATSLSKYRSSKVASVLILVVYTQRALLLAFGTGTAWATPTSINI